MDRKFEWKTKASMDSMDCGHMQSTRKGHPCRHQVCHYLKRKIAKLLLIFRITRQLRHKKLNEKHNLLCPDLHL